MFTYSDIISTCMCIIAIVNLIIMIINTKK